MTLEERIKALEGRIKKLEALVEKLKFHSHPKDAVGTDLTGKSLTPIVFV